MGALGLDLEALGRDLGGFGRSKMQSQTHPTMRLPKMAFLKRKMQNSCAKAARRHTRNYRKNLGKIIDFEDFHLSEGLRKGRNGSRFSKQNSFQNPPKIGPKLIPNRLKNRSWRPKAIKHRPWRPNKIDSMCCARTAALQEENEKPK